MTVNPLVVPRLELPVDAWSGVWIAEDIQLIAQGVRNRSWVDASLGGAAAGLDALAFVSDPVSSLLQYGIAWLIEHVRPLTEALDWLAGDPAAIAAHSATWHNIAGSVRAEAAALADAVRTDVPDWHGPAAIAYRLWNREQRGALHTLADGADTMALITETAGVLVAGVRVLVRDAIAIAVSRLIVYAVELHRHRAARHPAGRRTSRHHRGRLRGEDHPTPSGPHHQPAPTRPHPPPPRPTRHHPRRHPQATHQGHG